VGVFADGAHDVDGQQAASLGQLPRSADFAAQGFQIGGIDAFLGALSGEQVPGLFHQVGVMAAQIDRGNGAYAAQRGHAAGQPVGGDADAHAALNNGQQGSPAQAQGAQATAGKQ